MKKDGSNNNFRTANALHNFCFRQNYQRKLRRCAYAERKTYHQLG
nr:MAG TPA: hypothetical protein [Caudoviricetes sp.]